MRFDEVIWVLSKMEVYRSRPMPKGIQVSCPLAKWRHKKGTDNRPSMMIFSNPPYICYCWSCLFKAPLAKLVEAYSELSGKELGEVAEFVGGLTTGDVMKRAKTLRDYDDVPNAVRFNKAICKSGFDKASIEWADIDELGVLPDETGALDIELVKKDLVRWQKVPYPQYVRRRGITKETYEAWELGFDTKGHEVTRSKGVIKYIVNFGPRIIFPVKNREGRLVGWSGRTVVPENKYPMRRIEDGVIKYIMRGVPKYYHVEGFRKSNYLYGEWQVEKAERGYLVEGFTDVIALWQRGYKNALAIMGADLCRQQVRKLKAWFKEVVILPDGDEAGERSAENSKKLLEAVGVKVSIKKSILGKDPADLTQGELTQMVGSPERNQFRVS